MLIVWISKIIIYMWWLIMSRKLFCEYGPIAYKISLFKEAKKKDSIDLKNGKKFAKKLTKKTLSIFGKVIQW